MKLSLSKETKAYILAAALVICAAFCGFCMGAASLGIKDVLRIIAGDRTGTAYTILRYVRLPRVISTLFCGAALSVSGYVIQSVLANRLASPGIIGVNSGAGFAVTLCTALGVVGGWKMSAAAFIGALISVLGISLGARKIGASRGTVILMGVAVNSILSAATEAVCVFFPGVSVMIRDFRVGDFSSVSMSKAGPASVIIAIALVILFTMCNELDVLELGEETATGLGLEVSFYRTFFLILSALLAGSAVSVAGLLSFVGLIVPNILKKLLGNKASVLLPLCALYGGAFVCICDSLARTLFAPYEIPVGIVMSAVGAPFFISVLIKGKGGHSDA